MNKKTEKIEIDIPKDDIDCWIRYPKYRWVYDITRLLDCQNIEWSPFEKQQLTDKELIMEMFSVEPIIRQPGYIFTSIPKTECTITDAYIIRGDIKHLKHINASTNKSIENVDGGIEIRINAFISLNLSKFTGVISIKTYGSDIYRCALRPYSNTFNSIEQKLISRIYKKHQISSLVLCHTDNDIQEVEHT